MSARPARRGTAEGLPRPTRDARPSGRGGARRRRLAFPRALLALACAAALFACDTGPDGPGTVSGTVTGASDLGAVVLDVTWRGIQGFQGEGSTQLYSAPVPGEPDRYRVILVDPSGGDLTFGISVDDVYLESPVVVVVEAADTVDRPRPPGDLRVVLER